MKSNNAVSSCKYFFSTKCSSVNNLAKACGCFRLCKSACVLWLHLFPEHALLWFCTQHIFAIFFWAVNTLKINSQQRNTQIQPSELFWMSSYHEPGWHSAETWQRYHRVCAPEWSEAEAPPEKQQGWDNEVGPSELRASKTRQHVSLVQSASLLQSGAQLIN